MNQFRKVSVAEGISFLLLLFVAMPLKYFADAPEMVKYVGWAHGMLFIAYLGVGFRTAVICNWSLGKSIIAVIASLLPFVPFVFERTLNKEVLLLKTNKVPA